MKMMKRYKSTGIVLAVIAVCILACWFGGPWILGWVAMQANCALGDYVPGESATRFMEIVLAASQEDNDELLKQLATDEAIKSLADLQLPRDQSFEVKQIIESDIEYNFRVFYSDEHYFDVWLEHEVWPRCSEKFTDDEVLAFFKLTRVGNYHKP